jgi:hypothetical protein
VSYIKRKINNYTRAGFQLKLSNEMRELVFDGNDVSKIFISFLNIFLFCYSSFSVIEAKNKMNQNSWITPGIIASCKRERELYKELQNNNNNNATRASYYRNYSKILCMVIRKAKIIEHDKLILNFHNKVETTGVIMNKESG